MFQAATIKHIAQALSVSPSTVSRALRDSHEVSTDTKKLVLEYAKKINYRSNPNAQSLKSRRSNAIGVLVADVANSFFSQAINGIESVAYDKGYHVIITQSHDRYDREVINMEHLANRSVDGLLISMSSQTTDYNHVTDLHQKGLPMVFFDRIIDEVDTFKVTTDNVQSAFEATSLLLEKGFRQIGFLGNAPQLSITIDRLKGYGDALKRYGLGPHPDLVSYCYEGGRNYDEVKMAITALFSSEPPMDALLIGSDQISTEAVRVLTTFDNPRKVTIIGFSNSEVIDLWSPRISYIRQNAVEMGKIAAQKLIALIESKYPVHEFETTLVSSELHFLNENIKE
ncbi:LacI family transcriptional regulator [Pedobacter sp. BAL39]|uniref:LacI family DNA-binding transcriptional regulator n=1 Tax=Pedobacter sp. BAL39 TaxID=391596 RepID=UPI00015598A1|nr:LacI family DNA-binding transcriptional regulator [Pedobacter sp. BAL39]EDM38918.1 LacI family transcriptional regulator [Pedobacter sp. BAL39]